MFGPRCLIVGMGFFAMGLTFAARGAEREKQFTEPAEAVLKRAAAAATAQDRDRLKTLKRGHPRLYLSSERIDALKELTQSDPVAKKLYERVTADAEKILTAPVSEYKLVGPRLLQVSRQALDRIQTLGIVYRIGGDRRFADRAIAEMMAVCAFKDWHPAHFLDTAEMTNAVASGYDWLFDELSAEQRATARKAILDFGLAPAIKVYESKGWWSKSPFNWNLVCNGGINAGAMAVADEAPDLAAYVLGQSVQSTPIALKSFDPDGGWAEGPGYWGYATRYTAYYFLGLDTALGTDFGLSDRPGLSRAGWFRVQATGPAGMTFNYADASSSAGGAWQMFWFAQRYATPFFSAYERGRIGKGADAMHLVLYQQEPDETPPPPPLDAYFEGVQAAFFRSAWDDPDALYFAMKGGDNQAGHSHLDLGVFVLDALGKRWAEDLGGDDYNLPAYFGKLRWTYYRLRTEGHNTLLINAANQNEKAKAPILAHRFTPDRATAVADLSQGYEGEAAKVLRGASMLDRSRILLVDEVTPRQDKPAAIEWALHTHAQVELKGPAAILTQDDAHVRATILEPAGAAFAVREVEMSATKKPLKNLRKITFPARASNVPVRLAVLFEPYEGDAPPQPKPSAEIPLALKDWLAWAGAE